MFFAMNNPQVTIILEQGLFPGVHHPCTLVETHISWVILSPDFAFKIKKPVHLHFLDFSTLAKRHYYCLQELELNKRLSPDLYLAVLPISNGPQGPQIAGTEGEIIDYAVQMHRMPQNLQMDVCLQNQEIKSQHVSKLAQQLAGFHQKHRFLPTSSATMLADFNDLFELNDCFLTIAGKNEWMEFQRMPTHIAKILETHQPRLKERFRRFFVDGHGDLHTRNIFLSDPPLVFDCIEFNPHLRQIDVLSELAFLCMDLDFHQRPDLSRLFLAEYLRYWDPMPLEEDKQIMLFYKAYRANIRLKVNLLEFQEQPNPVLAETALKYWKLLKTYSQALS